MIINLASRLQKLVNCYVSDEKQIFVFTLSLDKTKALILVEPFYGTCFHLVFCLIITSINICISILGLTNKNYKKLGITK